MKSRPRNEPGWATPIPLFFAWRGWLARAGIWGPLEGALDSSNEEYCLRAVYALGGLKVARAVRLLSRTIGRLELPSSLRAAAVGQVGRLGLSGSCMALCTALDDSDSLVRKEACFSAGWMRVDILEGLGSDRADEWKRASVALRERLARVEENDPDGAVRAEAKDALEDWPQFRERPQSHGTEMGPRIHR